MLDSTEPRVRKPVCASLASHWPDSGVPEFTFLYERGLGLAPSAGVVLTMMNPARTRAAPEPAATNMKEAEASAPNWNTMNNNVATANPAVARTLARNTKAYRWLES